MPGSHPPTRTVPERRERLTRPAPAAYTLLDIAADGRPAVEVPSGPGA